MWKVRCTKFQENPAKSRGDTVKKVPYFQNKVPLIICRSQPTLEYVVSNACAENARHNVSFVTHAREVRRTKFHENPSQLTRHTAEKYIAFLINGSELFTDRYQTYKVCSACVGSAKHEVSGQSLQRKPRYSTKVTVFSKWNSLITDRNQNHIFCSVSVGNARYDVSGKSHQWRPRFRWRGTWLSMWSSLNYWRFTTKQKTLLTGNEATWAPVVGCK